MTSIAILPVIHYCDDDTAFENARIARAAGADGVFLISHHGEDGALPMLGARLRQVWPQAWVGLNFLSDGLEAAMDAVVDHDLNMLWGDNCGVSSKGLTQRGGDLASWQKRHPQVQVFASVAFKYQEREPDPAEAARQAHARAFVPTTSGSGTGSAPALDKIREMSAAVGGRLAIASGMTPDNVGAFAPYLSHILVSTGVSFDGYRFDPAKLERFVRVVRATATDTVPA